jgi:serine/threonine protein kinase
MYFFDVQHTSSNYYFVFELCTGGDLAKLLKDKGRLDEFEAQSIFRQLSRALKLLNLNGVVHRDLKPANILLSNDGDDKNGPVVKLADFGLAKIFKPGMDMHSMLGTPYYMAPEILDGRPYNEKADLWSAGIILFQIVCGCVPFPAREQMELKNKVLKGEFKFPEDVNVSPMCLDMICKLIVLDP